MKPDATSELRTALRFPVKLPIAIKSGEQQHETETRDVSAGGMMFHLETDMQVGSVIEFRICMPGDVLGATTDVLVTGTGRVVRCNTEGNRRAVAAVIDEYRFERTQ
jgi:hypothetical protein